MNFDQIYLNHNSPLMTRYKSLFHIAIYWTVLFITAYSRPSPRATSLYLHKYVWMKVWGELKSSLCFTCSSMHILSVTQMLASSYPVNRNVWVTGFQVLPDVRTFCSGSWSKSSFKPNFSLIVLIFLPLLCNKRFHLLQVLKHQGAQVNPLQRSVWFRVPWGLQENGFISQGPLNIITT